MDQQSDQIETEAFAEPSSIDSPSDGGVVARVDFAYVSSDQLLIYGWIFGFTDNVEDALIRIGDFTFDFFVCCNVIDRPDVSQHFSGADNHEHGFFALIDLEHPLDDVDQLTLSVALLSGQSQESHWPVEERNLSIGLLPEPVLTTLETVLPELPATDSMRLMSLLPHMESFRNSPEVSFDESGEPIPSSSSAAFCRGLGAYLKKVTALRLQGRLAEADAVASAAIHRFPESLDVWHEYALVAYVREDLPEAVRRWEQAVALFPDAVETLSFLASALRGAGRFEEAESLAKEALECVPDEPDLWNQYALVARDRGDLTEAARRWESMRSQIPTHPDGYAHGLTILRELGRLEEADTLCDSAVTLFPENPEFWNQRATIASERREFTLAARRCQEMLARFADLPEAYSKIAEILRDIGQIDEADKTTEEGLALPR